MFPSLRQRLLIGLAIGVGILGWIWLRMPLTAADGSGGLSLMSARVGLPSAIALVVAAGLPALILGALVSASGHPLSGAFSIAAALTVLAAAGGSIDGWMRRTSLPGGYLNLIIEVLVWQVLLLLAFLLMQRLRSPLRAALPAVASSDHLGADTRIHLPGVQSLGAGLVSAVVAGILACLLLPNGNVGQAIGALIVAFAIGGLVGQLVFPDANPVGVLVSPSLVAIAGYTWVLVNFHAAPQVLSAWYRPGGLYGVALVLPVFYASAGLVGTIAGIGIAHGLDTAKAHVVHV